MITAITLDDVAHQAKTEFIHFIVSGKHDTCESMDRVTSQVTS